MRRVALLATLILSVLLAGCATRFTEQGLQHYAGVPVPGRVSVSDDGHFLSTASVTQDRNPAYAERAAWARLLIEARRLGYTHYHLDGNSVETGYQVSLTGYLNSDSSDQDAKPVSAIRVMLLQPMPPKPQTPVVVEPRLAAVMPAKPQPQPAAGGDGDGPIVIMAPDDIVTGSVKPAQPSAIAVQQSAGAAYSPDAAATARRIIGTHTTGPVTGSRIDDLASAVERLYPSSTSAIPSGVMVRSR